MGETRIIKIEVEGYAEASKSTENLTKAIESQANSINALRAQNKALTQERNALDTSTDKGKSRIEELNKQLDANNIAIKQNVDSLAKQKINVGNYSGALDKLVPGLGATASGIGGMTTAAKAFIATPLGAIVGALGLALGALTAYFKGSEEGQDKLAKAMAIGKVVFEAVIQVVEKLGEVISDALGFIGDLAMKVVNFVAPQIGAVLDQAIKAGSDIADLQDKIEEDENNLIIKRAQTNQQVQALRAQAIKEEGNQKKATIEKAIQLEKDLAAAETQHVADKIALVDKESEHTGKKTEEQKKQYAELTAEKINQESKANEATIRFQKEIEAIAEAKAKADEAKKIADAEEKERLRQIELQTLKEDAIADAEIEGRIDSVTQKHIDSAKKRIEAEGKALVAKLDFDKKDAESEKQKAKIAQLEGQNRLANVSAMLGQAQNMFEKDSIQYKAFAVGRATIDTYRAADAALAAGGGVPFGIPMMLGTIALGLAQVVKILGIGFAEGGYTGDGGKYDARGIVHAGEFVIPAHMVSNPMYSGMISQIDLARRGYADGGLVVNSATTAIDQQAFIASAFKNMPPIYTSWTEAQNISRSVIFKESLVTA